MTTFQMGVLGCRVRNKDLVELGVRLEDRTDGPSAIKYDDPETLRAEVAAKAEQDAARAAEKQAKGGSKSVAQRRLELQKQEKVCFHEPTCFWLQSLWAILAIQITLPPGATFLQSEGLHTQDTPCFWRCSCRERE